MGGAWHGDEATNALGITSSCAHSTRFATCARSSLRYIVVAHYYDYKTCNKEFHMLQRCVCMSMTGHCNGNMVPMSKLGVYW